MTAYDNWLSQGGERPERDEQVFQDAVGNVADAMRVHFNDFALLYALYEARPALEYAMQNLDFPIHLRSYMAAFVGRVGDISAKVDDEYKSLAETYNDPRD